LSIYTAPPNSYLFPYTTLFRSYTNTYGPVDYLSRIFGEAMEDEEVEILSIATRPDCLGDDVMSLLGRLGQIKPVWMELGLQTIQDRKSTRLNSSHVSNSYAVFC